MANWYANRDLVKDALSIPASSTGSHLQIDSVLEGVSRDIDNYVGFHFYPSSGVRYYRPTQTTYLELEYPMTNIDSIDLDNNADSSYESALNATSYYTVPYNAAEESPPGPIWGVELRTRTNASAIFPIAVARGAKVTGTWGYYNHRGETTAKPSTSVTAAALSIKFTGASGLRPGMMVRLDSEQIFIERNGLSGSDTATTSGIVTVQRAQNGTTGATHSSNSTMSVYHYPIIDRAALYQAEMDYRGKDAPLGYAGGDPGGGQSLRPMGGLHPFVRRSLDPFRMPVVG